MKSRRSTNQLSWRKASGEEKFYFILHNLLSMALFFYIGTKMGLFNMLSYNLLEIISFNFLKFIGITILFTIILGILSRAFIYGLFYVINYFENKSRSEIVTIKSFWNINRGINSFTTYTYFKTVIYSSIAFAFGAVSILQIKVFRSNSLASLIGAYLIVKLIIYGWVWMKHK